MSNTKTSPTPERYLPRRTSVGMVFQRVYGEHDGAAPLWDLWPDPQGCGDVMLFVRNGTTVKEAAEEVDRMLRHHEE